MRDLKNWQQQLEGIVDVGSAVRTLGNKTHSSVMKGWHYHNYSHYNHHHQIPCSQMRSICCADLCLTSDKLQLDMFLRIFWNCTLFSEHLIPLNCFRSFINVLCDLSFWLVLIVFSTLGNAVLCKKIITKLWLKSHLDLPPASHCPLEDLLLLLFCDSVGGVWGEKNVNYKV